MKVYIVGIGVGNKDYLTDKALKIINSSDVLIGAKRMIDMFENRDAIKIASYLSKDIVKYIEENSSSNIISILVSGDSGFFSAAKNIINDIKYDVEIIPGISSISYFASRISIPWDNINFLSLHGRDSGLVGSIMTNNKTFILSDKVNTPKAICRKLYNKGFRNLLVHVGENLSYSNEKIVSGSIFDIINMDFSSLNVMVVENPSPVNKSLISSGINDDDFIRGKSPMTKYEVRRLSISKMNIKEDDIIYDIGAGTGSVSIEAALSAIYGEVFAIEKNKDAIDTININRGKFSAYNLNIINAIAPNGIENLPPPTKVFIGGSSGNMEKIIRNVLSLNPSVGIVINAITLETVSETLECFKKFPIKNIDITQVNISKNKSIKDFNMMMGQNPVYIFSGEGDGTWEE